MEELSRILPNRQTYEDQQAPADHTEIGSLRGNVLSRAARHEANEKESRRAYDGDASYSLVVGRIAEQKGGHGE